MAGRPVQTIEWAMDVLTKGFGVLASLGERYPRARIPGSDDRRSVDDNGERQV
jgi:hypothetical protein